MPWFFVHTVECLIWYFLRNWFLKKILFFILNSHAASFMFLDDPQISLLKSMVNSSIAHSVALYKQNGHFI